MEKILMIDDDSQICEMVATFLQGHGFDVTTAENGERGLLAAADLPDLILCDLNMPQLDGQAFVSRLRQEEKTRDIPVVFLSACTVRDQIRKSMNLGGDDFITKPAQLPEILEAIKARLSRRQNQRQQLDKQLTTAANIFVGIVHDLNQSGSEVRWLRDTGTALAGKENQIIQRVRQSLDPGQAHATPATTPAQSSLVLIKDSQRQHFLKLSEVKALRAHGEYAKIYWGDEQSILFHKPLKQWMLELPAEQFLRVHRQTIINLAFLDFAEKTPEGKLHVHLRGLKQVFPVSQREKASFNRSLKKYTVKQKPHLTATAIL